MYILNIIKPCTIHQVLNNAIEDVCLHYAYVFPTGDDLAAILDNNVICYPISDEIEGGKY
jgi:hypothetical protein